MARRSGVNPPGGPIRGLFDALARLHRAAGEPTVGALAEATTLEPAAVAAALHGPHVPSWDIVAKVARQLGADPEPLLRLWMAARDLEDTPLVPRTRPTALAPNPDPLRRSSRSGGASLAPELDRVTLDRLADALTAQHVSYLRDGQSSVLTLWERHAIMFTLEGPADEILVARARPHATVAPDWAERAYRILNEWNYGRRFLKTYVGDPVENGRLPLYGEMQIPFGAGAHDAQLAEWVDCAAGVAAAWVQWLHDDGALL